MPKRIEQAKSQGESLPLAGYFSLCRSCLERLPDWSGSSAKLFLALAAMADSAEKTCYPGWESLTSYTGLSRGSIGKSLEKLSAMGLVEITTEGGVKCQGGTTNLYKVLPIQSGSKNRPVQEIVGTRSGLKKGPKRSNFCDEAVQKIDSNKESRTKNKNNARAANAAECDSWFSDFWNAYPKRVAKEAAKKAYAKALDRIVKEDECTRTKASQAILEAATVYAAAREGEDAKFTKHAATWLNAGCYADEESPVAGASSTPFFKDLPDD